MNSAPPKCILGMAEALADESIWGDRLGSTQSDPNDERSGSHY